MERGAGGGDCDDNGQGRLQAVIMLACTQKQKYTKDGCKGFLPLHPSFVCVFCAKIVLLNSQI